MKWRSHTFVYCCKVCLLPFLTLPQVLFLHDPAQSREGQGQLLTGMKVEEVESLNMSDPAKRTCCVLVEEVQDHQKKKERGGRIPQPFGTQAVSELSSLPSHNGTGSM